MTPRLPSRRLFLLGGIAVLALSAGAAGIALAQGSDSETPYRSSITVPDTEEQNEATEAESLRPLAKISPAAARDAALGAVAGTAGDPQLENEDGNVVYSVKVTAPNSRVTDVKVDAGNGSVLAKEADDDDEAGEESESEGNEGREANDADEAGDGDAPPAR